MAIGSRKIPLIDPPIGFRVAVRHSSPLSCPPPLRVFNVQRIYPSGTFAQWRRSSSLSSSSPAFLSSRSGPSRRRKNEAYTKIALSVAYLNAWSDPNSSIAAPHRHAARPIGGRRLDGFSVVHRRRSSCCYPENRYNPDAFFTRFHCRIAHRHRRDRCILRTARP